MSRIARRRSRRLLRVIGLGFACALTLRAADRLTWKPVTEAVLKVDDQPAKLWNVYQAAKKSHLLLIQLGQRFLMLNTKAREAYELNPASLKRSGKDLNGPMPGKFDKRLASSGWLAHDVGPAEMIRVRLDAEGRVLEVQLPHPLDQRWIY